MENTQQVVMNAKIISNRPWVKGPEYQRGWTFWGMLFVMFIVILFAYIGMQLVPVYMTNANVRNAMELSLNDVDLKKVTRPMITRKIDAQLYLDGTYDFLNYKTDMKIKRSRKQLILETHYQREVPLFFNLSLIAKFDNVINRDISSK